jgi:hypothetical protein
MTAQQWLIKVKHVGPTPEPGTLAYAAAEAFDQYFTDVEDIPDLELSFHEEENGYYQALLHVENKADLDAFVHVLVMCGYSVEYYGDQ